MSFSGNGLLAVSPIDDDRMDKVGEIGETRSLLLGLPLPQSLGGRAGDGAADDEKIELCLFREAPVLR